MDSGIGGMNSGEVGSGTMEADRTENNSDNRSPTLKCSGSSGCGSVTGFVIHRAAHIVVMEDPMKLLCTLTGDGVNSSALSISFGCKHCDRGWPEHVFNYVYGREGMRVTRGYHKYANAYRRFFELPPLRYSQVVAIVNRMDWPATAYNASTRNSQHWAREYVENLQNATVEEIPPPPFKVVTAVLVLATKEKKFSTSMVSTEKVKFWNKDFDKDVTVKQMADKALEQINLKRTHQHYVWREVKQRRVLPNGSNAWVDVDNDAPIVHVAFYKVLVAWKRPKFDVSADILTVDEQGNSKVLQRNVPLRFWEREVTVSEMAAKAVEHSHWWVAERYEWRQVALRKAPEKENGRGKFVKVNFDDPIEQAAFYRVWVERQQEKIVDEANVEPGQQQMDEQPTTSKAQIQQPFGEGGGSNGAVPATIQNLDGHAEVAGEENIAENEHETAEIKQEYADLDDEPNNGNHNNQNGSAALRTLEENAFNEGNTGSDIPDEIAHEVKQEPIEPSEMDELIALQEQQQPSTSTSTTATAPPPAKKSRVQQKPPSSKRKKK